MEKLFRILPAHSAFSASNVISHTLELANGIIFETRQRVRVTVRR